MKQRVTLWDALQSDEFEEWAEGAERSLANRAEGEEAAQVVESAFGIAEENQNTLSEFIDN